MHTFLPRRAALFFAVLTAWFLPRAGAEEFTWKHRAGDRYRIISTVREDVSINREFSHHAEILNRISAEVERVEGDNAIHRAVFLTAEEAFPDAAAGSSPDMATPDMATPDMATPDTARPDTARPDTARPLFAWSQEYESVFGRDRRGRITIGDQYFMPVVRNVPVFPEGNIERGHTWTEAGHESHDFREAFGITEPYRLPFTARYEYLGNREWRGREYPAVAVEYEIDHTAAVPPGELRPRRIAGSSREILYWDREAGQVRYYEETFSMSIELSNGYLLEFSGNAEAELFESPGMDRERIADEINRELQEAGISGAAVEAQETGVTIVLEDIQFEADSAVLLPRERTKLDHIADILRRYNERDILVEGHTALAGSEAARERLSLERAGSVAEYLAGKAVRPRERILIRGRGGSRPRADNRTEAGRRQNRRVEITILEN